MNIDPKRSYHWQREAQAPLPADPAEGRQLRAAKRRLEQELEILKKPSPSFRPHPMSFCHCRNCFRSKSVKRTFMQQV